MSAWQKSARLYNELRNESSLELKLLLCHCNYYYNEVIALGKSNEYFTEIVS